MTHVSIKLPWFLLFYSLSLSRMKWFPVFDSRSACSYMPPRAESDFRWMMSLSMNKMNGALNLSDHFPFFFVFLSVSLILSGLCSPVFFVVNCDTLIRRKIVKGRELGQVSETDVRFAIPQQGKWQVNWKREKRERERSRLSTSRVARTNTRTVFDARGKNYHSSSIFAIESRVQSILSNAGGGGWK